MNLVAAVHPDVRIYNGHKLRRPKKQCHKLLTINLLKHINIICVNFSLEN